MRAKFTLLSFILSITFILSSLIINAQTATWTGASDNNWQNTANWDVGVVPDMGYDVVIPSAYTNKPIVNNINSAKSVTIQSSAELEVILSGSIAVVGNFEVYGTLNMTNGSVTVFGDGHLYANATLIIDDGALSASNCICDTLSTVIYSHDNPEIYAWEHGNMVVQGSGVAYVDGTYANPTICDKLILNIPLKIGENRALEVQTEIINNTGGEGIIIEAGTSGTGALMHGAGDIEGQVKLPGSASKSVQWHYISSPITSAPISTFNGDITYAWDQYETWGGLGDYTPWVQITEGYMQVTRGYAVYTNPYDITFYGYLNYANYLMTMGNSLTGDADNQGWNLIGNPYVAPIDWDRVVAEPSFSTDVEGAIYFMDDDDQSGSVSNYRYYVATTAGNYGIGTEDATSMIPVCQAFFVKSNADGATFLMKRQHRRFVYQPFYKDAKVNPFIKLSINGNQQSDELIFRVVDDSDNGFDPQFDARKLFPDNTEIPMIFSTDLSDDPNMAINSVPKMTDGSRFIIGVKAEEGNYSITFDEITIGNYSIAYLFDHSCKKYIQLSEGESYEFFHEGGIDVERFEIVFKDETPNPTNFSSNTANVMVYPNPTSDYVNVDLNFNPDNTNIEIYSQTGVLVKTQDISDIENRIDISTLQPGVYILKINSQNSQSIIKKIAVR